MTTNITTKLCPRHRMNKNPKHMMSVQMTRVFVLFRVKSVKTGRKKIDSLGVGRKHHARVILQGFIPRWNSFRYRGCFGALWLFRLCFRFRFGLGQLRVDSSFSSFGHRGQLLTFLYVFFFLPARKMFFCHGATVVSSFNWPTGLLVSQLTAKLGLHGLTCQNIQNFRPKILTNSLRTSLQTTIEREQACPLQQSR